MKKIVLSTFLLGVLSSASADGYWSFGATSADVNTEQKSGFNMGLGFGSRAKANNLGHQIGVEFDYINSDMHSSIGNSVYFKYQPHYGLSDSLRIFANVGYVYLQLAKTSSDGKTISNYADGIGYGVGVAYDITSKIGLQVQYKTMPLNSPTFDQAYDYTSVSGGVVFSY